MVNEAISANGRISPFKPERRSFGPFDIVKHDDQDAKVDQRRTYMMEIQYRDCMLVRVIWVGWLGGRGHQGLDVRVAFRDCSWKWQILRTQDVSIMMREVVGNE